MAEKYTVFFKAARELGQINLLELRKAFLRLAVNDMNAYLGCNKSVFTVLLSIKQSNNCTGIACLAGDVLNSSGRIPISGNIAVLV